MSVDGRRWSMPWRAEADDLAKTRKTAIVIGLVLSALGTLLVVRSSTPAQAVAFISMALFCVQFAGTLRLGAGAGNGGEA